MGESNYQLVSVKSSLDSGFDEPRGVPSSTSEQSISEKNIIKPEESSKLDKPEEPKVKPKLSSDEKSRWEHIAESIGKVLGIGNFEQGPEAKRNIIPPAAAAVSDKTGDVSTAGMPSDRSKLSGMLGLLLPLFIFATEIFETLTPVMIFASKTVFRMSSWLKIFNSIFKFFTTTKIGNLLVPIKPIVSFFTDMGTNIVNWFKNLIPGLGAGPTAAKGGGNFLTKILKGIGGKLLKMLKFVPIVGGIIGLGFAWSRFKAGDTGAAILELISAILSLIPFPPLWIASALIDGMLLLYDLQTAKEKETNPNAPKKGLFTTIANGFKNYIIPLLRYIPLIGGIMYFGDAMGNFASGNWAAGFKDLGRGMIASVGGKGLVDGFEFVLSLFSTDKETPSEPKAGKSFFSIAMEKISGVVGETLTKIKDWAFGRLKRMVSWFSSSKSNDIKPDELTPQQRESLMKQVGIKPDELTPQQRESLKKSGWSTWKEYEAAGWKFKSTAGDKAGNIEQLSASTAKQTPSVDASSDKSMSSVREETTPVIASDKSEDEISKLNGTFTQYHKNFKHATTLELTLLEEIRDSINKLATITGSLAGGGSGSSSTQRGILSNKSSSAVNFRNEMNTFTTPILL